MVRPSRSRPRGPLPDRHRRGPARIVEAALPFGRRLTREPRRVPSRSCRRGEWRARRSTTHTRRRRPGGSRSSATATVFPPAWHESALTSPAHGAPAGTALREASIGKGNAVHACGPPEPTRAAAEPRLASALRIAVTRPHCASAYAPVRPPRPPSFWPTLGGAGTCLTTVALPNCHPEEGRRKRADEGSGWGKESALQGRPHPDPSLRSG